jgi:hypothetical protein
MMSQYFTFIIGLLLICINVVNANLIQNPGFEDGMTNWQMISGNAVLTDYCRSGNYAIKLIDSTSRIQQISIPVNPNTDYRLWMWASTFGGGISYPNSVHYLMWVNDSLIYEETNGSIGPAWIGKFVDFNTGSADTLSVSFSCYWSTGNVGMVLDDIILVEEDTIPPLILSAEASDNEAAVPGIDNEDFVVVAFSEPMNKAKLHWYVNNLDDVLLLDNNHTWLNQNGGAGAIEWNETGDSLWIYFVDGYPSASVFPGDTITPDGITICDEWGNPVTNQVVLTGSFGGEYGYVEGNVYTGSFPPIPDSSGVLVRILETGQNATTDFVSGDYYIENIVTGEHKVIASRFLFMPETLQVVVIAGETTQVDFSLSRYYIKSPFFTDFEDNDAEFSGTFAWQWDVSYYSYSGFKTWWQWISGDNCSSYLYIPVIDLGSVSSIDLSFYHKFLGMGFFDRTLQISLDGVSWDSVASYWAATFIWLADTIDLSIYAGDTIYARFAFEAYDGGCSDEWYIDDFALSNSGSVTETEINKKPFLSQNSPNPANTTTKISYFIPEQTEVSLKIYDSLGRIVTTLVNEIHKPGDYTVTWDCRDALRKKLAAGIYFYCLKIGNDTMIRKLVLIE